MGHYLGIGMVQSYKFKVDFRLLPSDLPLYIIIQHTDGISFVFDFFPSFAEHPAFDVLPSLKRLKQRVLAAGRGQYDAVFMSGR